MTCRLAFVLAILAVGVQPGSASLDTATPAFAPLNSPARLLAQDDTRIADTVDRQPVQHPIQHPKKKKRAPRPSRPTGQEKWLNPQPEPPRPLRGPTWLNPQPEPPTPAKPEPLKH
jgi:hypothetical protein